MPDPRRFVEGFLVAAVVSLLVTRALLRTWQGRAAGAASGRRGAWLGGLAGLVAGWHRLGYALAWPPTTGLERLLAVVLPATVMIDLVVSQWSIAPRDDDELGGLWGPRLTGIGRLVLALFSLTAPVVLLWKSVYLDWAGRGSLPDGTSLLFLSSGVGLGLGAWSLMRFAERPGGGLVPGGLAVAVLTAGVCTLLGGYIKGGAIAFPLAGSLFGTLGATARWRGGGDGAARIVQGARRGIVTFGVMALYGVLLVGSGFGKLPGRRASLVGLAPLAGWVAERLVGRRLTPAGRIAVNVAMTLALLAWAVWLAKRDFDQGLGKML